MRRSHRRAAWRRCLCCRCAYKCRGKSNATRAWRRGEVEGRTRAWRARRVSYFCTAGFSFGGKRRARLDRDCERFFKVAAAHGEVAVVAADLDLRALADAAA